MALSDSINKIAKNHNNKLHRSSATSALQHPTIVVFIGDIISSQINDIKSQICSRWQNGESIVFFHFYRENSINDPNICSIDISKFVNLNKDSVETRNALISDTEYLKQINETISQQVSHIFDTRYMNSQKAYCTVISNANDTSNYISGELMNILHAHILLSGVASVFINAIHLLENISGIAPSPIVRREMLLLYDLWKKGLNQNILYDGFDNVLKPIALNQVFEKIYFLDERDSDLYNYTQTTDVSSIVADIIYAYLFNHDFPGYFKTIGLVDEEVPMEYLILICLHELNETVVKGMDQLLQNDVKDDMLLKKIQNHIQNICDNNYSQVHRQLYGNIVRLPFKPSNITGLTIDESETAVFGCAIKSKFEYLISHTGSDAIISEEIVVSIEKTNTTEVLDEILSYSKQAISGLSVSSVDHMAYVEVSHTGGGTFSFGENLEREIIEKKYDIMLSDINLKNKINLYKEIIERCERQLNIINRYQTSFAEFHLMVKQQKTLLENSFTNIQGNSVTNEIQGIIWNSDEDTFDYLSIAANANISGNYDDLVMYVYEKYADKLVDTSSKNNINLTELPVFCRLRCPVPEEFSDIRIDTGVKSQRIIKSVNLHKDEIVFFERVLQ